MLRRGNTAHDTEQHLVIHRLRRDTSHISFARSLWVSNSSMSLIYQTNLPSVSLLTVIKCAPARLCLNHTDHFGVVMDLF